MNKVLFLFLERKKKLLLLLLLLSLLLLLLNDGYHWLRSRSHNRCRELRALMT